MLFPIKPVPNNTSNDNNSENPGLLPSQAETSSSGETILTCTSPLVAKVTKGFQKEDFAIYEVDCKWKDHSWTIYRRFRQFAELDSSIGGLLHPDYVLPAKTLLPPKFSEALTAQRREGLDHYLEGCCLRMNSFISNDKHRRAFYRFIKPIQLGDVKGAIFSNDIFQEL